MGVFQRLANWVGEVAPLKCAVLGISFIVLASYIKGLPDLAPGVWPAVQRLVVLASLMGALLSGLFLLILAMVSTQIRSASERIAVLGFIVFGITFFHALTQLAAIGREKYLEAIVPILAGVLTAWAIGAFLPAHRRRSTLAERFAPRPPN